MSENRNFFFFFFFFGFFFVFFFFGGIKDTDTFLLSDPCLVVSVDLSILAIIPPIFVSVIRREVGCSVVLILSCFLC